MNTFSKQVVLGAAMLMATGAFAANKGGMTVSSPVEVGGKQIAAGKYDVQWEGNGPSVEANIMKGTKVVATVAAKVVTLEQSSTMNSAVLRTNTDGSRSLTQARFSGKKMALEFGDAGASSASGASSK